MKEVRIVGENGSSRVDEVVVVDNAKELVGKIKKHASVTLGISTYNINNTSGEVVAPIGMSAMESEFEALCSVQIVPYNKAGTGQ